MIISVSEMGENTGNQHSELYLQCFQKQSSLILTFYVAEK